MQNCQIKSELKPNMRALVDQRKELPLAFALLSILWLGAAVSLLLTCTTIALIFLILGMFSVVSR